MDDVCWVDEVKSEAGNSSLGKNHSHELREYWPFSCHSIANAFGKTVFITCLCCDCALHAWPLE